MFTRYGPNSLKVNAFIRELEGLTAEQFSTVGHFDLDLNRLKSLIERIEALGGELSGERGNAFNDALKAAGDKGATDQRKFVAALASILVVEDRLNREERTFLSLFIIDTIVPLRLLYVDHTKEDLAIEDFCKQLSRIDGENVYLKSRPDERGQSGQGLPDFIVHRAGQDLTVEHTLLVTYKNQVFYERLFSQYFDALNIEQRIREAYPDKWINISIPVDAFQKRSEAEKFDFDKFIQNLIEAVGQTPESYNASKTVKYEFPDTPFPVYISNGGGDFHGTLLAQTVPTHREQIEVDLREEITKAVNKKRKKLLEAKRRGQRTVLLLDSDDYALVNEGMLAEAFGSAAANHASMLEGIDDVYIQHRRGNCWIVPVKLGDRIYPDLPEYEEYWRRQGNLL
jgi:hypothetical protein